jgi:hypothetical protein
MMGISSMFFSRDDELLFMLSKKKIDTNRDYRIAVFWSGGVQEGKALFKQAVHRVGGMHGFAW